MADFCKQCSIEIFGEDFGDLARILTPEQEADDMVMPAICEGCGYTYVNCAGECVGTCCDKRHYLPKENSNASH